MADCLDEMLGKLMGFRPGRFNAEVVVGRKDY